MIDLSNPDSSSTWGSYAASNVLDYEVDDTYDGSWYSLDPSPCVDTESGMEWWSADFTDGYHSVTSVRVLNSRKSWNDDIARAQVTVEGQLCGTLPSDPGSG